jgi:hypothetical protein
VKKTHLDVTSPSVEIEVEVLDFSIFSKLVTEVLFVGFFMNVAGDDNPAFDGSDSLGTRDSSSIGLLLVTGWRIDVHFGIRHVEDEKNRGSIDQVLVTRDLSTADDRIEGPMRMKGDGEDEAL